jgi:allantoicase
MAMQTDVKSKYLEADGAIYAGRARLKGLTVSVSTAGAALIVYDNASAASGTKVVEISTAAVGTFNVLIPGQGVLAENGLYLDINGAAGVTAYYG